ncbi:MAG: glycosyltransferase family 39 protein [Bacteroidales bacterium]|nr:glycosyltransferase family 39 protein [Bacteroidales bacterium]
MKQNFKKQAFLIILGFSFVLYGNTLFNDYALDDAIVITQNQFTKKGFSGIKDLLTTEYFTGFFGKQKNLVSGGRYRPLSTISFAIEYEFFGKSPGVSHFFNIIFYALTGYFLFLVLLQLFPVDNDKKWWLSLSFLATIIWLAHPIHTEAVANIKGRDEILTMLGSLLAMWYAIKFVRQKKPLQLILSSIFLFLGIMAKETAITFLFIIPFAIYLFVDKKGKTLFAVTAPLLVTAVIYLIIRFSIVGLPGQEIPRELMNNPFLYATGSQKFATIILTFIIYIKLLFFPHPLTYDYYPYHIHLVDFGNPWVIFSILFHLALVVIAFATLKKNKIISFALFFYFASFSLVSNVLFPVGTFMNERFMFMPSIAFALILTYYLLKFFKAKTSVLMTIVVLLLLPFAGKTIVRNRDWKDDLTLFTHDVNISYDSAKSNTSAGGKLIEAAKREKNSAKKQEMLKKALFYLHRAVEIHPRYSDALLLLGNGFYDNGRQIDSTWYYYKKILLINPNFQNVFNNLKVVLNDSIPPQKRLAILQDVNSISPNKFWIIYQIGNIYGRYLNNLDSSITYLLKAETLNPNKVQVQKDLGVAYGMKKDFKTSLLHSQKAATLSSNDAQIWINMGITYQMLGDTAQMRQCFAKADAIKQAQAGQ